MQRRACPHCGGEVPPTTSPGGACPRCLMKLGLERTEGDPGGEPRTSDALTGRIGPYKILATLGEGGMGVVYLAEQTEPVKRRVALKLIKLGMDTRQVIARFEAERQALALMNHPNVARVFDAGTTEQGRPYFVMEYVPGIPISEYCDLKCLPLRERLVLFTRICDAIQHAHQKGIIHRDIKPSNVLVASEDGKPQLKVIDFGVAKATGQKLTERTLFTQQGILIGTPEYMSPEQAGTTTLDVDTRTDIYSLGVLLYELLVGALPFDPDTLRRAAAVEMLRIIREEDPPKPTTRFSSLGATAVEIARQRHTDVRSLARQLRGELEWITMRALEKDPGRRYSSASELAADVRRHLDDEPVVAGPPSRWYRVSKFVRKNRGPVAAAALLLFVLAAASVVTTAMYVRSERARAVAELEARRNELDAEAMRAAMNDDVAGYLERSRAALELHRSVMDTGDPRYLLYLVNRWGSLNWMWWDEDQETPGFHELLAELREETLQGLRDALPGGDPRLVELLNMVGELSLDEDDHIWVHREALRLSSQLGLEDPEAAEKRNHLSELVETRSLRLRSTDRDSEADALEAEAIALRREAVALARRPAIVERARLGLAGLLERSGIRLLAEGDAAAAAAFLEESLDLLRDVDPGPSRRIAGLQVRLGRSLVALGRYDEAELLLEESHRRFSGELSGRTASAQVAAHALAELYQRSGKSGGTSLERATSSPTVVSLRELGPVQFGRWLGGPLLEGRLGGYSVQMGNRALWVFELSRPGHSCESGAPICTGSWSWTDDLDASNGIGGFGSGTIDKLDIAAPLPWTGEEATYNALHRSADCVEDCRSLFVLKPGAIAMDEIRGRALLFYHRGIDLDPPWAFTRQGTSIALWTDPTAKAARPTTTGGDMDLFSADEPRWGSAALVHEDQLYAYACRCRGADCPCLVARAPASRVLDREAWRFRDGAGSWIRDWRSARPVMEANEALSIHWNEHLGRFLAIHSVHQQTSFAIRTAERPEGPWSEELLYVVGVAPEPGQDWEFNVSALGHPEYAREGGRIEYVTYYRPTKAFWRGETRLIEITFE